MRRISLLLAVLLIVFLISEPLKAQSSIEIGQELTEKYFSVLGLAIPDTMNSNGSIIWEAPLPSNFNLNSVKSDITQISDQLDVKVIVEWIKVGDSIHYPTKYKGHDYVLTYRINDNTIQALVTDI